MYELVKYISLVNKDPNKASIYMEHIGSLAILILEN